MTRAATVTRAGCQLLAEGWQPVAGVTVRKSSRNPTTIAELRASKALPRCHMESLCHSEYNNVLVTKAGPARQ